MIDLHQLRDDRANKTMIAQKMDTLMPR